MTDPTRSSLLLRVRDPADAQAWSEFDLQYRDLILGYCFRRGLQLADAEDVRQATLMTLARRLQGFELDARVGRFRDYLGRIVIHEIAAFWRRSARNKVVPITQAEGAEAPSELVEAWEREWIDHHLRLALDRLRTSTQSRSLEVFEALLRGEAAYEVARRLGLKVEAVYKIKQRVKERLQAEIEQQMAESEFPEEAQGGDV